MRKARARSPASTPPLPSEISTCTALPAVRRTLSQGEERRGQGGNADGVRGMHLTNCGRSKRARSGMAQRDVRASVAVSFTGPR